MQSIKKRLSIIILVCTVSAVLMSALLVNLTINNTFNEYMSEIQAKRDERIISYFEEVYKKDNKWTENSGIELMHEAYMGNYCITLYDRNRNVVWGMDPGDIKIKEHFTTMNRKSEGVYTTRTYEIKSKDEIVGYIDMGQYFPVLLSREDVEFKFAVNKSIIVSVLITILMTAAASLFLSKQFSAPVIEVSDTSVQLSRGNYDARSRGKSSILEIKNLEDSINILGEKLKKQDSIRKRLISDISHELRTPLNILQNNLEAMADGILPATGERLASLNTEVIRFGRLLDNLNVLKEFESEEVQLNIEKVPMDKLIQSVVEDFRPEFENKGIEVMVDFIENGDYTIKGDKDKLKQVFINILSNSVKFSHDIGKIWIELRSDKNSVEVKIKDNGMGIDKKDLPFVFERLYRGDKSRHEVEGSGIGLTIVKKILMLHSADINIESELGKGTIVTLCFKKSDVL